MTWQAFTKNETVPPFTEGEQANIQDVSVIRFFNFNGLCTLTMHDHNQSNVYNQKES